MGCVNVAPMFLKTGQSIISKIESASDLNIVAFLQ